MRAGQLNRRIVIRTKPHDETINAYGAVVPGSGMGSQITLPAQLVSHSLTETARQFAETGETLTVFRVRRPALHTIDTDCTVTFEGRGFSIVEVKELGRTGLELRCQRVD